MQKTSLELDSLIKLFYNKDQKELGSFEKVENKIIPPTQRKLLDHNSHMTVIVEEHHHSPANLVVVDKLKTANSYSRKIVLEKKTDGLPVLFAIAHLNFKALDENVKNQILQEDIPLGHILLRNNLQMSLQLISLFKIIPGKDLIKLLKINSLNTPSCYGRTAVISSDNIPIVEVLEIVPFH